MTKLVYGSPEYQVEKEAMLAQFGVIPSEQFDPKEAIRKRIDYLKSFLRNTERKGYVLGISGGVDSTTVGRLCKLAAQELREEGYDAKFIAMRLPAGIQKDESDAQAAIRFIDADVSLTVNIGEAATNLSIQGVDEFKRVGGTLTESQADFNKGNLKARLRMAAQYQVAAMYDSCVASTDHNSEASVSFYTKWGDQGADFIVLNGLNKTQVRMCAKELGAPESLWNKKPTADLEELLPLKTDDEGFGFEYNKLDAFLEGKEIDRETEEKIVNMYKATAHKRLPIVTFPG